MTDPVVETAPARAKAQVFAIAAAIGVATAALALGFVALVRPDILATVPMLFFAVVGAVIAWLLSAAARRGAGAAGQPVRLAPWQRTWAWVRAGSLVGLLLLSIGIAVAALAGAPLSLLVHALIYLILVRTFLDALANAAGNMAAIAQARSSRERGPT